MGSMSKVQSQCLEQCYRTTKLGDRISVHMLEYFTSVKQLPGGLDALAHGLLDTCHVLFALEAGLEECAKRARPFPDTGLLSDLEKKLRATHADFQLLDQLLGRFLEYDRKGKMGRIRRGWGKIFGESDFEKTATTLARDREMLRISALVFRWSLDVGPGVASGFEGLAAALKRIDQRLDLSVDRLDGIATTPDSASKAGPNRGSDALQPPLPPLPWSETLSSLHSAPTIGMRSMSDARQQQPLPAGPRQYSVTTTASSIGSHERVTFDANGSLDRTSALGETASGPEKTSSESDGLLEDVAGFEIDPSKAVRLQPLSMPRWHPRTKAGPEASNLRSALISGIRGRNHQLVEQLLDRGASPGAGPDGHPLREAIRAHDNQSVCLLLLFGAECNETDEDGVSPLLAAVEGSFLAAATALLKYGADPNPASPGLDSPLSSSVMANKIGLSHLILIYGGGPEATIADGNTLLISAINKKTPKALVDLLLAYSCAPDGKSRDGRTALFEAIQASRADIVRGLLEHGANPNLPGPKHMLWPATYQPSCLQILLSHGADYKKAPGIMELAKSTNNIDSVRILIEAGVDVNAKKDNTYTPLCSAIRDNRSDIFQLLLSNKADPNIMASEYPAFKCVTHDRVHFLPALVAAGADLSSPKGILETAVSANNPEALLWLLDQGLDPNSRSPKGHSALTSAIRDNRPDMVDLLISRGADPNVRGEDWPVCMAVRNPPILKRILDVLAEPRAFKGVVERAVVANQLESVRLLLAAGVSVEDKNGGVFSPLTSAVREGRKDTVSFLIGQGGADVNAPGEHLPIVKALRRYQGDSDIIEMLLQKGADPNRMYRGWNAMMQALENGDLDILKLLVEKAGVDVNAKDELGRTVIEMAASRGWDEAVDVLLHAGVEA